MTMKVIRPGVQATIQDYGRIGAQKYGIVVSGAMDKTALRIGNILVQNTENEAGIEVMFYGTTFTCTEDQLIAITGGDLQPVIDGQPAPMWRPICLKKGSTLSFKGPKSGLIAYVAIAGGIDVNEVIGSKSTFSKARIGGYKGRALQADDHLHIGTLCECQKELLRSLQNLHTYPTWYVSHSQVYSTKNHQTIRVLKGREYDLFSKESQSAFTTKEYTLTTQADRMGYTFTGERLQLSTREEMLSEGVTYGTIQVPASGNPIVLMAERQTTGGYPKIGQVITADLSKIAQLQPSSRVTFQLVSMEEAERELMKIEEFIEELKLGIYLKTTTGGMAQ